MHLHVDETGTGPRTAVLLHGMMGSSESWWRIAPLLVDRGYRVLAIDLPGHGLSDRDGELTVERAADAVARTVADAGAAHPDVAIGHSYGGQLLAAAAPRLAPALAVYVDSPFSARGGWDRDEVAARYESDRRTRTSEELRSTRPYYSDRDCVVEGRAAERFDPATAAAVSAGPGGVWMPASGSIVVRPDPSGYVDDARAAELTALGVEVRSIPGGAHSLWYSHFDEFVAALPEVFGQDGDDGASVS
jgi:pimeloyl-ACP methyl ester carboxylesterase